MKKSAITSGTTQYKTCFFTIFAIKYWRSIDKLQTDSQVILKHYIFSHAFLPFRSILPILHDTSDDQAIPCEIFEKRMISQYLHLSIEKSNFLRVWYLILGVQICFRRFSLEVFAGPCAIPLAAWPTQRPYRLVEYPRESYQGPPATGPDWSGIVMPDPPPPLSPAIPDFICSWSSGTRILRLPFPEIFQVVSSGLWSGSEKNGTSWLATSRIQSHGHSSIANPRIAATSLSA